MARRTASASAALCSEGTGKPFEGEALGGDGVADLCRILNAGLSFEGEALEVGVLCRIWNAGLSIAAILHEADHGYVWKAIW